MAETFCGKTCVECTDKASINCPGCRVGPGNAVNGDCDIARCCRSKGHKQCDTCTVHGHCGILRGRNGMPQYRQRKLEAEKAQKVQLDQNAALMGKWLFVLFELVIAGVFVGLIDTVMNIEPIPFLQITFALVNFLLNLVCCLILLRLASVNQRYRVAGVCEIAVIVLTLIENMFAEASWVGFLTLIAVAPALIGEYNEYMAHAEQVDEVDSELAEKWRNLWYWYIGSLGVMVLSTILTFIATVLAALVLLAATIATLVVSVMKIVYLYKTAAVFRNYTEVSVG